jgi:hypothetical protein
MTTDALVHALVRHLTEEWRPAAGVRSETDLDREMLREVRAWAGSRFEIPQCERPEWIAGHGPTREDKKGWKECKRHQIVRLWGAGKASDVFLYHGSSGNRVAEIMRRSAGRLAGADAVSR